MYQSLNGILYALLFQVYLIYCQLIANQNNKSSYNNSFISDSVYQMAQIECSCPSNSSMVNWVINYKETEIECLTNCTVVPLKNSLSTHITEYSASCNNCLNTTLNNITCESPNEQLNKFKMEIESLSDNSRVRYQISCFEPNLTSTCQTIVLDKQPMEIIANTSSYPGSLITGYNVGPSCQSKYEILKSFSMKTEVTNIAKFWFEIEYCTISVPQCAKKDEGNDSPIQACTFCNNTGGYYAVNSIIPDDGQCYNFYPGYFVKDNAWTLCYVSCLTCSGSSTSASDQKCLSCQEKYALMENTHNCFITTQSRSGYYLDNGPPLLFKKCYESCDECYGPFNGLTHNCRICKATYARVEGTFNCILPTLTVPGYYLYTGTPTRFKPCYERCATCSGPLDGDIQHCTSCKESYVTAEGTSNCYNSTSSLPGYYLDNGPPSMFKQCYEGCATCSGPLNGEIQHCTSCKESYVTAEGTSNCYSSTSPLSGYYLINGPPSMFKPCYDTCAICPGPPDGDIQHCSSCKESYVTAEGTSNCYNSTSSLPGYYLDKGPPSMFKQCYDTCATCSGPLDGDIQHCSSCKESYVTAEGTSNCYNSTSPLSGYYLDNGSPLMFKPCYQGCDTCSGPPTGDSQNCFECQPAYASVEGTTNCSSIYETLPGYFLYQYTVFKCCYDSCATCSGPLDQDNQQCISCKDTFALLSETSNCYPSNSTLPGYYLDNNTVFKPCYDTCATCSGPLSSNNQQCNSCKMSYVTAEGTSNCYNSTSSLPGYYLDNGPPLMFKPCYDSCATCSGSSNGVNHYCTECKTNYYPLADLLSSCYSVKSPPVSYTLSSNKWQKCGELCESCTSDNNCLSCSGGYFLDNGLCKRCIAPCATCSSATNCTTCVISNPSYMLLDGQCLNACPDGQYYSKTTSSCFNCQKVCAKCKNDSNYCVQCASSSFLFPTKEMYDGISYQCLNACPIAYYPDSYGTCKTCKELGKVIMDGNCVQACASNLFIDANGVCGPCDKFIFLLFCVEACPAGFAPEKNVCKYIPQENGDNPEESTGPSCDKTNPCLNGGSCYLYLNILQCNCLPGTQGTLCDNMAYIGDVIVGSLSSIRELNNSTMSLLNNLMAEVKNNSAIVTPELSAIVYDFAENQMNLALSGRAEVSEDLIKVSGLAFSMKLVEVTKTNTTSVSGDAQNKINNLKSTISSVVDLLVKNNNNTEAVTIISEMVSVQYANSSNQEELKSVAIQNNISVIAFVECESALKKYYHLPNDTNLIIKKIDYNGLLNLENLKKVDASNSVAFEFFNPITMEKLNSTEACKDSSITVSTPLKESQNNKALYNQIANLGINMYDKNGTAFNSRCFQLSSPGSGADTSVNFRRNTYYQNKSIECGADCIYGGVNEYGYVDCNCTGECVGTEVASTVTAAILGILPPFNIEILACYYEGFKYPDIFWNPAFYVLTSFIGLAVAGGIMFSYKMIEIGLIKNQMDILIQHDAKFYEKEMDKEDYFDPEKLEKMNTNPKENIPQDLPPSVWDNIRMGMQEKRAVPLQVGAPKTGVLAQAQSESHLSVSGIDSTKRINYVDYDHPAACQVSEDLKNYVLFKNSRPIELDGQCFANEMPIEKEKRKLKPTLAELASQDPTIKDYLELSPYQAVLYDRRKFFTMLLHFLIEENLLVWLIMKRSLLEPLWYRILYLFFNLSMVFAINAIMFSDDYIDNRVNVDSAIRVSNQFISHLGFSLVYNFAGNVENNFFSTHYLCDSVYCFIFDHAN